MAGGEDWSRALDLDTSDDVHVTDTIDGITIFYTERVEAFIRTDTVVDVYEHR